jgi:hypothetical protein
MLWAWEEPEELGGLDAGKAGVAFLSREVLLGESVEVRPRRQRLVVTPGVWLMAVVRVETAPGFHPSAAKVAEIAGDIVAAAGAPNVRGLQIDFDALASERDFYARILREVRAEMPAGMPLSITALASWCGGHSWLGGLPVDESVPMFFRMGGPAALRATAAKETSGITEPLCLGSVGVATDETWPDISAAQRVYVFRPGSWSEDDVAKLNTFGYQSLRQ